MAGQRRRGYCDVEDTVLDSTEPNTPQGGDYTLDTGPGKTVLIRFGSLNALLGAGATIVDAKLILTTGPGAQVKMRSIARTLKSWGEGPAQVVMPPGAPPPTTNPDGTIHNNTKPIIGAATWKERLTGIPGANWTLPGAIGSDDTSPIPDAAGGIARKGVRHRWARIGSRPDDFES